MGVLAPVGLTLLRSRVSRPAEDCLGLLCNIQYWCRRCGGVCERRAFYLVADKREYFSFCCCLPSQRLWLVIRSDAETGEILSARNYEGV